MATKIVYVCDECGDTIAGDLGGYVIDGTISKAVEGKEILVEGKDMAMCTECFDKNVSLEE